MKNGGSKKLIADKSGCPPSRMLLGEAQEKFEGIAVARDRLLARTTLRDEALQKKVLQEARKVTYLESGEEQRLFYLSVC